MRKEHKNLIHKFLKYMKIRRFYSSYTTTHINKLPHDTLLIFNLPDIYHSILEVDKQKIHNTSQLNRKLCLPWFKFMRQFALYFSFPSVPFDIRKKKNLLYKMIFCLFISIFQLFFCFVSGFYSTTNIFCDQCLARSLVCPYEM